MKTDFYGHYATVEGPTITIPSDHTWEGTYFLELGRVEKTHIGFEDHGIFSWSIQFKFSASGQGTGHYRFIEEMIGVTKNVIKVVGVNTWEALPNSRVYVIRRDQFDRILGLANIDEPETKWMFLPG